MASGWSRFGLLMLLAELGRGSVARAEPPPSSVETASDANTLRARRHFKNGLKLYKDANYTGALAEFEAAYAEKPGPGSLQNVALSLKALFRYAEAAEALKLLLARHANDLSVGEQEAMRTAIAELESLVGTLYVSVEPEAASVSINGRIVTAEERARGIHLNVGEHTLVVEADGYARDIEVIRIASQQQLPVRVKLAPTGGFLEIVASDPKAAIAIDDEPLAYGRWSGPVSAGIEHRVQVYRDGYEPFEQNVRVELGKTTRVVGKLGAETGDVVDEQTPLASKPSAPPKARGARGFYGLLSLSVVGLNDSPLGLELSAPNADRSLPAIGVRGGYRISEPVAVEALIDFAHLEAKNACQPQPGSSDTGCYAKRDFALSSLRFGPNLRLLTRGETLRFSLAVGAGVVGHWLNLDPSSHDEMTPLQGGSASGIDPYFNLELGASYNYHHLLLGLDVIAYIDGATQLQGNFDAVDKDQQKAVFESGTLPMLGLGLKVGYSAWSPK